MIDLAVHWISLAARLVIAVVVLVAILVLQNGPHAGSPLDEANLVPLREPIVDIVPIGQTGEILLVTRNGQTEQRRLGEAFETSSSRVSLVPAGLRITCGMLCPRTGLLLVGTDDGAVLAGQPRELHTWNELGRLPGMIVSVDVSTQGRHVCASSDGGHVGAWSLVSGRGVDVRTNRTRAATYARFLGGTTHVASRTLGGPSGIWDCETGTKVRDWRVPVYYLYDHVPLESGAAVCTGRVDEEAHVLLVDAETDEVRWNVTLPMTEDTRCHAVRSHVLVHENIVAAGCGGSLWLLDLETGELIGEGFAAGHKVASIAAWPDADTLLTGGSEGTLHEWDIRTLAPRRTLLTRLVDMQ